MNFVSDLRELLRRLLAIIGWEWLAAGKEIIRNLCDYFKALLRNRARPRSERRATRHRCVPINHPAYKRPDPLIYSQFYLKSLGLAVTWNNPDIQLFLNGSPVSSSSLQQDTEYEIVARIWNNSTEAPIVELPVRAFYRSFGVGAQTSSIGGTAVNLGVKGGPNHPAFASFKWRTPTIAGHYCLQIILDWL